MGKIMKKIVKKGGKEKPKGFPMWSCKGVIVSLFVLIFVLSAPAALAHNFTLDPDCFVVPVGGLAGITSTFTEIVGSPDISLSRMPSDYPFFLPMTASFEVFYKGDANSSPIAEASFKPGFRGDYAKFEVKKAGTAVVQGKFSGMGGMVISHVKTFLNLTRDGVATKRFGGDDVLEVVFAEDVPADGVQVGDTVRFTFYLNGSPLANESVFASYAGAPQHTIKEGESDVDINYDYLTAKTDANGVAAFTFDQAQGWFVGAMGTWTSSYGGGVMFPVSGPDGIEGSIADAIIEPGKNEAGISFPIWTGGSQVDLVSETWGLVAANSLISEPKGTTGFLSGEEEQLPGVGTGAKISIPMDVTLPGKKGLIGFGQMLFLTPDMLGKETFDTMAAFLKNQHAAFQGGGSLENAMFGEEEGYVYYIPYTPKVLFDRVGLAIMTRFSDGEVRDMTGDFMLGVMYDENTMDYGIAISCGGMAADSAPVGGSYSIDGTNTLFPQDAPGKWAFIYDGKADGKIEISYWLVPKELPAELPITGEVIAGGKNKAEVEFTTMPPYNDFIVSLGLAWANELVTSPKGTTSFVTNQSASQLPSNTGVGINIPFDVKGSPLKGLIGVGGPMVLTPAMLGEDVFKSFTNFLKDEETNNPGKFQEEDGIKFYMPYTPKELLDRFGIEIMCRFGDGKILDVTDTFVFAVAYDQQWFTEDFITVMVGGMVVDSPPVDGSYWLDLSAQLPPEIGYKIALVYDGAADDAINYSYWLAKKSEAGGSGGGGGCNAGLFGLLAGLTAWVLRKRVQTRERS